MKRRRIKVRTLVAIVVMALAVAIPVIVVTWTIHAVTWRFELVMRPTPSPDGSRIAFVAVSIRGPGPLVQSALHALHVYPRTIDAQLWTLDRETGRLSTTTLEVDLDRSPMAWRPDSSELVFVSGSQDDLWSLHGFDPEAQVSWVLVDGGRHWSPSYSPDGAYLGYVRMHDWASWRAALVIEKVGSGPETVVDQHVNLSGWRWTRDGSRVIFVDGDMQRVFEYEIAGGSTRQLYSVAASHGDVLRSLVLSPDGKSIGFHESDDSRRGPFMRIDLESDSTMTLFCCDLPSHDFVWGEAGISYIDWDGEEPDSTRLVLHDPSTRASRILATGWLREPTWLSRTEIVVIRPPKELCVIDIETGTETRVFPLEGETP